MVLNQRFCSFTTTNKLVNEAANDSARARGQDRKKLPALGTNQITGFRRFRPLASSEKDNNIYLMGDFNIDLLKYENCKYSQTLLQCMQSFSMLPTIDKPTRVYGSSATLIDNIFTNNLTNNISSGNIVTDTTDHFSQLCIVNVNKQKLPHTKKD